MNAQCPTEDWLVLCGVLCVGGMRAGGGGRQQGKGEGRGTGVYVMIVENL